MDLPVKITFLGTGTSLGVPIIGCDCPVCSSNDFKDNRLRSSVLVHFGDQTLVVDAGPDFRQQMIRSRVKRIDAILLTHEHKDHVSGLDDIRAFNFLQRQAIDIYAEKRVQESIRKDFAYVFSIVQYPGIPQMALHTIDPEPFEIGGMPIIPVRAMHYKLPILGFRFGNLTYISDANYLADEEIAKISGSEILVINALRWEPHLSHYSFPEAFKVIEAVGPRKAYLTHLSHQAGRHQDLGKKMPAGIEVAYDGLEIGC